MTHTLSQLCQTYLADYHSDTTPKTRYGMEVFCRQLLQDFGDIPLVDLTTDAIRQWITTQRQHLKTSTVHRKCSRLSAMLRVAVEEYEWLPEHPMLRIRKPSPGRSRVRFLADDERRALLSACQRSRSNLLYPLVLLALSTGGRKDELRTLRWGEIDTDRGIVTFLVTKTHQARSVPLTGEALRVMRTLRQPHQSPRDWVFPGMSGKMPRFFDQSWRIARRNAGITNFRFHDLRHTFASYMAMSGATLRDIAELLGHTKLQQTMCYSHLVQGHTAPLVARMSNLFLATGAE